MFNYFNHLIEIMFSIYRNVKPVNCCPLNSELCNSDLEWQLDLILIVQLN